MTGKKMFFYTMLSAILGFFVTLVTWQMNGWPSAAGQPVTYVTFLAWATYFLFGANLKGAWKALCSMTAGIAAAIFMLVLSFAFGSAPWWAVPLAVAILMIPMMYAEKVKPISTIPAVFLGTGIYFSLSAAGAFAGYTFGQYLLVAVTEILYVCIGFAAGWITIQFSTICSKMK